MTSDELIEKIEKEETWLLYVLIDKPDMAFSYSVDIAFDSVKHYVKDYINSQQKVGKWEWVQYDENPEIGNFHCSECRYIPAIFNMSAQKLNYCPKCGAKMEVE